MNTKNLQDNMTKFWNGTNSRNAHLGLDGEAEFLLARAKALVSDKIKVKGKRVIDFGHGGGYLGLHLLADCEIAQYIGFDIAERSNKRASENLRAFDNKELILLTEHRWNFADYNPDIIICLACIIHFPTQVYLDNFLVTCEKSGAKNLILEIRDKGHGTEFQREPYSAGCFALKPRTCLTCNTDKEYVKSKLPSYRLTEWTDPAKAPTQCQVLWFSKR